MRDALLHKTECPGQPERDLRNESDHEAWLATGNEKTDALQKLLTPYPAEEMRAYPVSPRVNNVKNDGPELVQPA